MALIVGTNTYVSLDAATTYADLAGLSFLNISDGADAEAIAIQTAKAEASLKRATLAIDRLYGARFIGFKATLQQPLLWPRHPTMETVDTENGAYVVDSHGNYRDFTGIPVEVQHAVTELAVMLEAGYDPYVQPEPTVTEESVEVDVIKQSRKFQGVGHRVNEMHKIDVILSPLLHRGSSIRLVR